jgi:hypothetical protein
VVVVVVVVTPGLADRTSASATASRAQQHKAHLWLVYLDLESNDPSLQNRLKPTTM